jgi:hypothetical protein
MTPWGAVITQLLKRFRRGEYAGCLRFYLSMISSGGGAVRCMCQALRRDLG